MSVSVIITSYNQLRTLKMSIQAFRRQTVMPLELIVADDGSVDGTLDWLDRQSGLRYITRKHDGYSVCGIGNMAFEFVTGDRVLFCNADVIHNPQSVEKHASLPSDHVGGGVIREIGQKKAESLTLDDVTDFQRIELAFKSDGTSCSNIYWMDRIPRMNPCGFWGGNYSFPAYILKKTRGFNGDYQGKYGGEEPDLVQRAMIAGAGTSWVHESVGFHLAHYQRAYKQTALGITKYRKDWL